jgi:hypothetical protein
VTGIEPEALDAYEKALQEIQSLASQRAELTEAQYATERQFIQRLASDFTAGRLDLFGLFAMYGVLKEVARERTPTVGLGVRWNEGMPFSVQSLWSRIQRLTAHAPNEDGVWRGSFPFADGERYPARGQSVVYVLYDAENAPCYVGSTKAFRTRLKAHAREGKAFTRWLAYPCAHRAAAYALEDRLLKERTPYLNNRPGR